MSEKLKVGVVGYGYWGPNMVRVFHEIPEATVTAVSDLSEKRLEIVRGRYPTARTYTDPAALFADPEVEAVVIATPVTTHHPLTMAALKAGKHVLVEKPIAASAAEAEEMVAEARARNLTLQVDHTFCYTGAVRKIGEMIRSGEVGDVYYYDSVRVNLGLFQHDVNVLWDLAVHDLSIMDFLLDQRPVAVSATGLSHVPGKPENIAYMTLFFDSALIAHVTVNWLAPVKLRKTLVSGSRRMIVYDEIEPDEKIKVYDKGITVNDSEQMHKLLVGYRAGDMFAPRLEVSEALKVEAQHFVNCVRTGETPQTPGEMGLRIVRMLEAADRSLARRGAPVELPL